MGAKHRDQAKAVVAAIRQATGLSFQHDDRLTREEARAVATWAGEHPQLSEIYRDRRHPDHAELASYANWVGFFEVEWPQNDDGTPREWSDVQTRDDEIAAAEAEIAAMFEGVTPEEAKRRLDASLSDPKYADWKAAYTDPANPLHDQAKQEFEFLHRVAYPEAAAGADTNPAGLAAPIGTMPAPAASARTGAPTDRAGALREIDARYADPEFTKRLASRDRQVREAANAELDPLFRIGYPEPGQTAPAGTSSSPSSHAAGRAGPGAPLDPAAARSRVDQLYADREFMGRYGSQNASVRAAATAEMEAAMLAAYPAPPATDGAPAGDAASARSA